MRDGRVVGRVQTKETNAAELARLMVGREVLLRVEKTDANAGDRAVDCAKSVGCRARGESGRRCFV